MKNTIKALIAAGFIGAASIASAIPNSGMVQISNTAYDGGQNPGLQGGEFNALVIGDSSFVTFCLELGVYVNSNNGVYNYSLSSATDNGGSNALSAGSAFLYEQFVKGTLYARSFNGDGNDPVLNSHDVNAGYMQAALWVLEDQNIGAYLSAGQVDKYVTNNPFLNSVIVGEFGSIAAAKADYTGSKVRVMNLFDKDTNEKAQDQIVYVPDAGATAALMLIGLGSIALFRRRK